MDTQLKENTKVQYNQKYIWLISMTAALGGFLFGYDWVVIGGAKPFYEPYFNVTSVTDQGWGTSSALLGCMLGAGICILISDKVGRKKLLLVSGLLFSLSALGTALADSFAFFNLYRIVGGVAMGIALNLSPLYIAEVAPSEKRGMFVTINQLLIMIGVLLAQIVNYRISIIDTEISANPSFQELANSWSGQYAWRWMFGAEFIPAFLFFVLMFRVPESARWLIKNGRVEEARSILKKMGGSAYANKEIKDVSSTVREIDSKKVDLRFLFHKRILKFIIIGIFLAFLQQWSGINVVIYYAADIFKAAGFNLQQMMLNIVVIGMVMVLSVFITIFTVDKFGRKKLLLIGTGVMAVVYGLIGYSFLLEETGTPIVVLVLINVMVYSFTLAPLLWVVLSEIFPTRIRGAAVSVAALAHWVGNFTLTFSFPTIKENLGWAQNFWLYGVICLAGFLIIYRVLPETKGKTLEEIEHELIDS